MIIDKINTSYDGKQLKTTIDVNACDCEIETLYEAVGQDINICSMCDGCCDGKYDDELPEPIFGGAFYNEDDTLIYIEKVIYSKPNVIVLWSDGTKTRSTCDENDVWNPELGLTLSVMKKIMNQNFVSKLFRDWAVESSVFELMSNKSEKTTRVITLKDVRRNSKDTKDVKEFIKAISSNSNNE